MDEHCTYRIEVRGRMDGEDLNARSPVAITLLRSGPTSMLFNVHTDQSGLIGLVQHLHRLGLALLAVSRQP